MWIKQLSYALSEGFRNIRKNGLSAIMSVGIVMVSLLIMNLVFSVTLVIRHNVSQLEQSAQVEVFCYPDSTAEEISAVGSAIYAQDGVASVTERSQEDNYQLYREYLGEDAYLLDQYDSSIISPSFIIDLDNVSVGQAIVEAMEQVDGVQSVQFPGQAARAISAIATGLDVANIVITVFLSITSAFVISNTIRIALMTRKREIGIMRLIGATDQYIQMPFSAESILLSVVGAVLALVLSSIIYSAMAGGLQANLQSGGMTFIRMLPLWRILVITAPLNILLSALLGYAGSKISLRKYLEV